MTPIDDQDHYDGVVPVETYRQKECYSISEIAEMFGENIWTIRLWSNRFDALKPHRNRKGGLLFTPADVQKIGLICRLTKKKGTTLADVRKHLESVAWETAGYLSGDGDKDMEK